MATVTTQNIVYAGTAPTFTQPGTTDTCEVGPRNFVVYKNTNASSRTVTVEVPATLTPYTQQNNDVQYTLAGTNGELWIPLHSDYDTGAGRASITVSSTAGVTSAVVKAGWVE
jgi:hypothetical protein